jgi:hypothetical protein
MFNCWTERGFRQEAILNMFKMQIFCGGHHTGDLRGIRRDVLRRPAVLWL